MSIKGAYSKRVLIPFWSVDGGHLFERHAYLIFECRLRALIREGCLFKSGRLMEHLQYGPLQFVS